MRCRHCNRQISFDVSRGEYVHVSGMHRPRDLDAAECWIQGAAAGTLADPKDKDTWEDDE